MTKSFPKSLIKISYYISATFNPMNSLLFFFAIFNLQNNTLKESFQNFLPILLITIIPISAWIFWNVKKKRYTDSDVSDRKQRKSLYVFIVSALAVYLIYLYLRFDQIDWIILFLGILIVLMQISNYFIKSSMHTAINIFVAALFFTMSPLWGLIWLGITMVVGISRIILKRHSPREVLSGTIIGLFVSFIYLYVHIQTLN